MRRWIDLTNEAQHGGIREVSLERAEGRSSVDRLDPVCLSHGPRMRTEIYCSANLTGLGHDMGP